MANRSVISKIGVDSTLFVSQIAAAGSNYDIATAHTIKFFNGQEDTTGVEWNGIAPLEVVIPTLSDIVSNPVVLKGVVNSASDIPASPSNGDLLYIGTAGSYFNPAVVCEAGDMAVYYDNAWHVISGENQTVIEGAALSTDAAVVRHTLDGTAVSVLEVEGKHLELAVDYSPVATALSYTKNAEDKLDVYNGTVTVPAMNIALSQADGTTLDITKSVSISLPTALADGTVTVGSVLQASDFTFTSGSFPTIVKNSEAISVTASHNMGVLASEDANGDFLAGVTAIKGISFNDSDAVNGQLGFMVGLSAAQGSEFINNIRTYDETKDEGKSAAFSVWGQATVATSTFVNGLSETSTSGDLVSSITIGEVSLDAQGTGILTSLSTEGNDVITSVNFGGVAQDTTAEWFFSGLSAGGSQVVTDVTVGAVSFVSGNSDPNLTSSAIITTKIDNRIFSFPSNIFTILSKNVR